MMIEENELRDTARRLLSETGSENSEKFWSIIRDAGWPALTAPEEFGGLSQPLTAACWLYGEIGRALSPAQLLSSLLSVDALAALPPSAARDEWITKLAAGEAIITSFIDPSLATLKFSEDNRISGSITGVSVADDASHMLIVATDPSYCGIVPLAAPGVTVEHQRMWDETRRMAHITLQNVDLKDCDLIARGDGARPAIAAYSVHLHFAIAADCVGAAEVLLYDTIEYLKTRHQFDRPLAMFQAIKHRCADLKASVMAAEALLAEELQNHDESGAYSIASVRGVKALASSVFRNVTEEAMQLHGGISMTVEHPCHLFLKRALLNEHLASDNDACNLATTDGILEKITE